MEHKEDITQLLQAWQAGNKEAEARVFELLLPDLRRMARGVFKRERAGHTLQATALVNEAFLRLSTSKNVSWQDRGHFYAIAARVMRRYLIDHARSRPGVDLLPVDALPESVVGTRSQLEIAVALDTLLDELGKESPVQRSVVELKFYLGLTDDEAAEALNITLRTLQREWYRARRWLFERLSGQACKQAAGPSATA